MTEIKPWSPETPYAKGDLVTVHVDGFAKFVPALSVGGAGPIIVCVRGGMTDPDAAPERILAIAETLYQSGRKTIPGPGGTRIWRDEDVAWAEEQHPVAPPHPLE